MLTCSLADSTEPELRHEPVMIGTKLTKVQEGACQDFRVAAEFLSKNGSSGYAEWVLKPWP